MHVTGWSHCIRRRPILIPRLIRQLALPGLCTVSLFYILILTQPLIYTPIRIWPDSLVESPNEHLVAFNLLLQQKSQGCHSNGKLNPLELFFLLSGSNLLSHHSMPETWVQSELRFSSLPIEFQAVGDICKRSFCFLIIKMNETTGV